MSTQGKLGKDAGSVACSARERPRTQIQRRHACSCVDHPDRFDVYPGRDLVVGADREVWLRLGDQAA
jgi:hypothetical protein